jgi:hypothetical protein
MPTRCELAALFPPNWFELAQDVKLRAGLRCEQCGAGDREPDPLVVVPLDHNPANVDRKNLRCWCRDCAQAHDPELAALSAMTRKQREQLVAPPVGPGLPLFKER